MPRIAKEKMQYWEKHYCWCCGKHSIGQRVFKLYPKVGGYICKSCHQHLFGKDP